MQLVLNFCNIYRKMLLIIIQSIQQKNLVIDVNLIFLNIFINLYTDYELIL
jgi:hypothetical protein